MCLSCGCLVGLCCLVWSCGYLFLWLSCVIVLSCLVHLILFYLVLSCLVLPCSCLVWSCLVVSCVVLSYLILSRLVSSRLVLSYLVLSCVCFVLSYLVLSLSSFTVWHTGTLWGSGPHHGRSTYVHDPIFSVALPGIGSGYPVWSSL